MTVSEAIIDIGESHLGLELDEYQTFVINNSDAKDKDERIAPFEKASNESRRERGAEPREVEKDKTNSGVCQEQLDMCDHSCKLFVFRNRAYMAENI